MQDTFVFFQLLGKLLSVSELRFMDPLASLLSINELTIKKRMVELFWCHWGLCQKAMIYTLLLVTASRSILKTQLLFPEKLSES